MTAYVKDGGVWKPANNLYVMDNPWKEVMEGWVKDGGVWKKYHQGSRTPNGMSLKYMKESYRISNNTETPSWTGGTTNKHCLGFLAGMIQDQYDQYDAAGVLSNVLCKYDNSNGTNQTATNIAAALGPADANYFKAMVLVAAKDNNNLFNDLDAISFGMHGDTYDVMWGFLDTDDLEDNVYGHDTFSGLSDAYDGSTYSGGGLSCYFAYAANAQSHTPDYPYWPFSSNPGPIDASDYPFRCFVGEQSTEVRTVLDASKSWALVGVGIT